jgi:hypothetical protein
VVQQRYDQQSVLDATVWDEHRDEADGEVYDDANRVFDAEGMDVGRALEAGIDDVCDERGGKEAEEPFAAGEEVLLVAGVVAEVGGKEQGAEKVIEDRVDDDEEIFLEGPLRDQRETELPPPEVDYPEKKRCGPARWSRETCSRRGCWTKRAKPLSRVVIQSPTMMEMTTRTCR